MVTDDEGRPYFQRYLDKHWTQFKDATIADFTQNLTGRVPLGDDPPRGNYIIGPTGTGKTHLLVALYREQVLTDPQRDIAITPWLDIVDALKSDFDKPEHERRESHYYKSLGVLMIDDFGKGQRTGWVLEQMYAIINARYVTRSPTYFTSEYPLTEVEGWGMDGASIASRIRGMCNVVVLVGEDRRVGQ